MAKRVLVEFPRRPANYRQDWTHDAGALLVMGLCLAGAVAVACLAWTFG